MTALTITEIDRVVELVALAMGQHGLAIGSDACICGQWADGGIDEGWDDHMAQVAVEALADRLMPEGCDTAQEWRWVSSDGGLIIPLREKAARGHVAAYPDSQIQTRTVYATPWTPEGTDG